MNQKIAAYLKAWLTFIVRKILIYDLALFALVCLSFIIWGPFSATALSERLVWTGLAISMVAGFLVFGQTTGGRQFGVPGQFQGSVHGQSMIDFNIEARQAVEGRMSLFPRIFVMGFILFLLGALVQVLFA